MALLLLFAAGAQPAAVMAQQGAPVQLVPGTPPATSTPPPSATPPSTVPPSTVLPGPDAGPAGIRSMDLPALGADSTGALGDAEGGLGADLWTGTDRARADDLIARLPVETPSRAMRDLMRRLLLTAAVPPAGGTGDGGFIEVRAGRLMDMGDPAGAVALTGAVGRNGMTAPIARIRFDALLLAGDRPAACEVARAAVIGDPEDRYLQRAVIFCDAREEALDRAWLALNLLLEPPSGAVPADHSVIAEFYALWLRMNGQAGGSEAPADLVEPSVLHLAMLAVAGDGVPALVVEQGGLAVQLAAVANGATEPALRLAAAERAARAGALHGAGLAAVYGLVEFDDLTPGAVLGTSADAWGPEARARVHQASALAGPGGDSAQLLSFGIRRARARGWLATVADASAPAILAIERDVERLWFAEDAARALWVSGNTIEGRYWFNLLRTSAAPETAGDETLTRLWPLARLADSFAPPPRDQRRLAAWRDLMLAGYGADRRAAVLLLALLDALGEPLDSIDRQTLLDDYRAGAPGIAAATGVSSPGPAAAAGRRGGAVLVALVGLGEAWRQAQAEDQRAVNPVIAWEAVAALHRLGLVDEARAVAFDLAMLAGL